jgi:hypothetical protein
MVGVFFTDQSGPANNFVSGYINPNSSFFAVFSTDKPIEVVDGTDAANSLINRGPSVYTSGTVTAVGSVTAGAGVTMTGGAFIQYRPLFAASAAVTLTASQLVGGVITRNSAGATEAFTLPLASAIITALGSQVGASTDFIVSNTNVATNALVVAATSGDTDLTTAGSMTVSATATARFTALVTSASTVVVFRA